MVRILHLTDSLHHRDCGVGRARTDLRSVLGITILNGLGDRSSHSPHSSVVDAPV